MTPTPALILIDRLGGVPREVYQPQSNRGVKPLLQLETITLAFYCDP